MRIAGDSRYYLLSHVRIPLAWSHFEQLRKFLSQARQRPRSSTQNANSGHARY
jgi:hypothetical protein